METTRQEQEATVGLFVRLEANPGREDDVAGRQAHLEGERRLRVGADKWEAMGVTCPTACIPSP